MKQIFEQLRTWLTTQKKLAKAKKQAVLKEQSDDIVQIREFNGSVYLSYMNVPLVKTDTLKTSIPETLAAVREVFVKYKEKGAV